jgi:mycothiol synthase
MEALSLVLCDIAPSQRQDIAQELCDQEPAATHAEHGLFAALRGERLCGAVWGQPQPGNTAVLWPPQLTPAEQEQTAHPLAEAAVCWLDSAAIGMSQVLLPGRTVPGVGVLESVGFRHLADLLYLSCEADRFPTQVARHDLEFVAYESSHHVRLAKLIEQTYLDTLDCPDLNGARHMDDVIAGYQATGMFRPENWLIVRSGAQDVGVLLLAEHPSARHWELVYMGLVPAARGYGWGRQITQHAQELARRANVERIVLAVDAANVPALAMYRAAGFEMWDRRTVYVRFAARS